MSKKTDITVIILTYNEELHIRRCLENVAPIASEIFIIDSFSTDRTLDIAKEFPNVTVFQHVWENNHAKQFNWGLDNVPIKTQWILRLDADEYLDESLINRLNTDLQLLGDDISSVSIRRKNFFLGKCIRGGTGKKYFIRLFRNGRARSEMRIMDEHISVLSGNTVQWEEPFYDNNLNNLYWWTSKHNGYAIREAASMLDSEYNLSGSVSFENLGVSANNMRRNKSRYARLPLFFRSFAYFLYRFIFKGGCLDGKEGFIWCILQGWWYRTLVDANIYQIKKKCDSDPVKIKECLKNEYGIDFN